MIRQYQTKNVYEALQDRLEYLFQEFENIYISFSGGKDSLNLYRIIDPEIWAKLVGRVRGANFGAIYAHTKALGYRNVTLPEGHTWESYTRFLLDTLPKTLQDNYIQKFNTSIKFWHER